MGAWSFGNMCSRCVRWSAVLVDYGLTPLCIEHYGRRFWPGTTGYQTVKAPDLVFQSLLDASLEADTFKGMFVNDQGQPELVTDENAHLYGVMEIDARDQLEANPGRTTLTDFGERPRNIFRDCRLFYRDEHLLAGWAMGRNFKDWMGRFDWPSKSGYQLVAF